MEIDTTNYLDVNPPGGDEGLSTKTFLKPSAVKTCLSVCAMFNVKDMGQSGKIQIRVVTLSLFYSLHVGIFTFFISFYSSPHGVVHHKSFYSILTVRLRFVFGSKM